ncbi:MAG: hypothetical protein ACR2QA_15595 [Solirubrobacteraceae bacterium]
MKRVAAIVSKAQWPEDKRVDLLQVRRDCIVAADDGGVVTKTFCGEDAELQWRLALQEYDRLREFTHALLALDGAACPEALDLVREPLPQLRMTHAAGVPVPTLLRARQLAPELRQHLAITAARALELYVERLDEPYYDFHFANMLYDETSGTLTFLDLGLPPYYRTLVGRSALGISLGNLIGSTIFHSARPREFFRCRAQGQAVALCAEIAVLVLRSHPTVAAELPVCVSAAYARPAQTGRWHRRLWYAVVAPLVARPVILGRQAFSLRTRGVTVRSAKRWSS